MLQEYGSTEAVHSNVITITGTTSGDTANNRALPFIANVMSGNVTTAKSTISAISPSTFIAEKNAFTQNPIVRLYSIYYPGEWYPPNEAGNPTGPGEGRAWPSGFPIRIAEIVGDIADDISYNVTYNGTSYIPFPVNISGIEQSSDGKINDLSLTLFNVDNMISVLVEDPNLVGNNTSNAVMATVNGELVHGLDPRTVNASPADVGTPGSAAYTALSLARSQGLVYDEAIVAQYGAQNSSFTYDQAISVGGSWSRQRSDSRDLLGGVVEIKTTFANFLDYWPEHSTITGTVSSVTDNTSAITVTNAAPYRLGDIVTTNGYGNATITNIEDNSLISLDALWINYFDISQKESQVRGIYTNASGNLLYVTGSSSSSIHMYKLSKPWDLFSATFENSKSLIAQDSATSGIFFNNSGSNLYIAGTNSGKIYQYSLTDAWNVETSSYTANANIRSIAGGNYPSGIFFTPSGSALYTVDTFTDSVYQLTLNTPWDITTATLQNTLNIGLQETAPYGITFSATGDTMFISGGAGDDINQYNLTESWNVATAVYSNAVPFSFVENFVTSHSWNPQGNILFLTGQSSSNVYQFAASTPWDITTLDYTVPPGNKLYIVNTDSDVESYIEDKFRIDQLESLSDHVATFSLTSWLQYFKMIVPRRKFYKNTCQWVYKSAECQYPGPGGLPIPGTDKLSTKPYNLQNEETTSKSHSLISWSNWSVGTSSISGYTNNGDGNSRKYDQTPYNERKVVWDVSNQDTASNDDGGWNTSNISIDNSKLYRFSVWIRRKTIGNGSTYLGTNGFNSINGNTGLLRRDDTSYNDGNPYFTYSTWGTKTANDWYLFVGHVWPVNSGTGSTHIDSGIYKDSSLGIEYIKANKQAITRDFVWKSDVVSTNHRAYLYYSTNTSTNQQFYQPRIDVCDGNEPTIEDLLTYSGEQLLARNAEDICSKSLAACTLRNNNIHYGGFPGVGRTIPRA